MHAVNAPSLPAQRCPLMLEMSRSENIPHCPCMAVCLIESSHDPLSSGYAYDSVPPGRTVIEHDRVPHYTLEVFGACHSGNLRLIRTLTSFTTDCIGKAHKIGAWS